jgi:G patch domain-containing protein 1
MLDFFRTVAQTIPSESSPGTSQDGEVVPVEPIAARDDSKRAGIIVLREDLDFYAIPPRKDITHEAMLDVKRAAAHALQQQDGIFSGLKRSDEPGTTEAHLIQMLTAGYVKHIVPYHDQTIQQECVDQLAANTTTQWLRPRGPMGPPSRRA